MQTIQYRKSRIWEMKDDKYTKSLVQNQVCAVFHMRDSRKNVLPNFIRLSGSPIWPPGVFLLMREFFARGAHNDERNIY